MSLTIEDILRSHGVGSGRGVNIISSETEPTSGLSEGVFWYNPTDEAMKMYVQGEFRNIGGSNGQFFSTLLGRTTISAPTASVQIPVTQYNPDVDVLLVYKNSVFIQSGVSYTVNKANKTINAVSGQWDTNTTFEFVVLAVTSVPQKNNLTMIRLEDHVNVVAGVSKVTFSIPAYNSETDILEVHQRNLPIYKDINYTLNPDGTSIQLKAALETDEEFHFVVYKNIRDDLPEGSIEGEMLINGSVSESKLTNAVKEKLNGAKIPVSSTTPANQKADELWYQVL